MIEVEELEKRFGGVPAVKGLSFKASDGAITGLLGSNGAGKTTTLRMICGVLEPSGGRIRIDHAPVLRGTMDAQRRLGALLDHTGLYPRLTARENLMYFGELRGLPPSVLKQRVEGTLEALGLGTIADRRTGGFSQGEHMKTALARAILHSPQNLLLDEPTNGLDVPTVRAFRTLLREMRDSGMCIIFSSHVLEEVTALCDKVVIIARGTLVACGTPKDLCRQVGSQSLEDAYLKLTC
ncbi:MAG: ATP-binding cassette domain-containing protein [Acidobacteria bacterium]|nr:ATP-binding cassette domain-containing protein [Acidobacteriota bacterium]